MGGSSSKSPKGKSVIAGKLATAEKTGVLNLADQDLKASSQVWDKLQSLGLVDKLKTLDISGNTLKYLPADILHMLQLKVLHAARCNIQRTYDMGVLTRLHTLSLNDNDLEADCLAQLPTQLQRLNLRNNHMVVIPQAGLVGLLNLTELNLSGNRLISCAGLGVLMSLVDLNLDGNSLSEISPDLALCSQLKHLSIKNNRLSGKAEDGSQSIPAVLFTHTLLDELLLPGNAMLSRAMVYSFEGVAAFVERRKRSRDRNLAGGAAGAEENIFGDLA
jgi:Leucine-rich repeat (LRR) protein